MCCRIWIHPQNELIFVPLNWFSNPNSSQPCLLGVSQYQGWGWIPFQFSQFGFTSLNRLHWNGIDPQPCSVSSHQKPRGMVNDAHAAEAACGFIWLAWYNYEWMRWDIQILFMWCLPVLLLWLKSCPAHKAGSPRPAHWTMRGCVFGC
jgi:hypothetical protein